MIFPFGAHGAAGAGVGHAHTQQLMRDPSTPAQFNQWGRIGTIVPVNNPAGAHAFSVDTCYDWGSCLKDRNGFGEGDPGFYDAKSGGYSSKPELWHGGNGGTAS
eukprot:CAMPEP_0173418384 /NCGR_PEP_ID=MMETSP1357-20121228/566_1 /TAXON_ID=77926 /ORGANISM="Hemiselmis rufescens, Strain PCC563" /LENGTH=103 /DNA_ID=CAMNT_0014380869 /DNA_START=151 /DNA_END=459 /DNA_ORIENTATION=-